MIGKRWEDSVMTNMICCMQFWILKEQKKIICSNCSFEMHWSVTVSPSLRSLVWPEMRVERGCRYTSSWTKATMGSHSASFRTWKRSKASCQEWYKNSTAVKWRVAAGMHPAGQRLPWAPISHHSAPERKKHAVKNYTRMKQLLSGEGLRVHIKLDKAMGSK